MQTAKLPTLFLKRREERRLRHGHPWVFSNEVDVRRGALADLTPGEHAEIRSADRRLIGRAYVNPQSLICARLVSRGSGEVLDAESISRRIARALARREQLFEKAHYRLIFGESDDLPGLTVDRYGDVVVVQIGTAGIEKLRGAVVDALRTHLSPAAIVLRNDGATRSLEGLDRYVETAYGEAPDWVRIEEHGVAFEIRPVDGQKTGWYFDQRDNRKRAAHHAGGARVLDVCCYGGAFGVQAAVAGAREVVCVDSSRGALEQVQRNASLNEMGAIVSCRAGDAFDVLKALIADGEQFDIVIVDPPAFVRRRKDLANGAEAYRRLNRLATRLLGSEGILVSASCSSHLRRDRWLGELRAAAEAAQREIRILEQGHQGPDHPVLPGFPESEYLKACVARVQRAV